jgi:hypothetical protein
MTAVASSASVPPTRTPRDGGIALDRTRFPVVWFKGGSELGVLTLNYLAATAAGRVVVASLLLSDPVHTLAGAPVAIEALGALRGGIELALS